MKRIVVLGFLGACPISGVVWQHLHYLVGLQRLGHRVVYVEDSAKPPYDPHRLTVTDRPDHACAVLAELGQAYGFPWSYRARYLDDMPIFGTQATPLAELYRDADAILNICGSHELNADLLQSDALIYVESDPGVEQIKVDQGDTEALAFLSRHACRFTFGENLDHSPVPLHGLEWLPTRQPVVTEFWQSDAPPAAAVFTTIANWSTAGRKDIRWRGEEFSWRKDREFLRFATAPQASGEVFEMAADVPDSSALAALTGGGWRLRSPHRLSCCREDYRNFVKESKGEFTVAKEQYVKLRTGWFSDRSACYLAAGRPVITQDTQFPNGWGTDGGLFAFTTPGEVVEAVRAINSDYRRHSRAAQRIAVEMFEATHILRSLLDRAGI